MTTQSNTRTRSLAWEDEASGENRYRSAQRVVSPSGRALPGMPLEMPGPDREDNPRPGGVRFGAEQTARWRPASSVGRFFFALALVLLLGGLVTAAFFLKTGLSRDPRFRIAGAGNIEATGLGEVSRPEMLPVFGEDIGRNIFFVPLSERRKQLEAMPWVEHATVMRLLPDRIRVQVVERQPVAFVRHGGEVGLVDASGVLLAMPPGMMARHHYSFPVVTGIDQVEQPAARKARMEVYAALLADLDANHQHLSEQISEIDLSDPEDAKVLMPEQGADILAHFGEDHFLERYQRYKGHIEEWRKQFSKLGEVDLRYEDHVVLKMAQEQDAAQLGPGQAAPGGDAGQAPTATLSSSAQDAARKPNGHAKEAGAPAFSTKSGAPMRLVKKDARGLQSAALSSKSSNQKTRNAKIERKRARAQRAGAGSHRRKSPLITHPSGASGQKG